MIDQINVDDLRDKNLFAFVPSENIIIGQKINEIIDHLNRGRDEAFEGRLAGFLSTYIWYEEKHPEELLPLAKHIVQFLESEKK